MIPDPRSIQSTPLRLTILLVMIFAVASAASFAVAYLVIRATYDAALEDEISQQIATYQAIDQQGGLIERLTADVAISDPELVILQYTPDHGALIANVLHIPTVSGFAVIADNTISHGDRDIAESYLARSTRIGHGQLIVAQSRAQIIETGEIILNTVLIGLLPALIVASLAGAIVARRARQKIDGIQATLVDLTSGNMAARVPIVATEADDLSTIGNAVNRMATSHEALIASMRQVSADIAHDLKTPIQRVAVILDQIVERTDVSDGQAELLARAREETDGIVKTFQALLQLAQIEGGAVRDRLTDTDLKRVATDVFEFLEAEAEERGYALRLQISGDGPFVIKGDHQLLSQVIANLIQNGLRHTPVGSKIAVTLARTPTQVTLKVSDNGPGIPEGERENVLQRLYRMEKSRTTDGNGLGLSLVAAICALHGAKLTLSDANPGLSVGIAFPTRAQDFA